MYPGAPRSARIRHLSSSENCNGGFWRWRGWAYCLVWLVQRWIAPWPLCLSQHCRHFDPQCMHAIPRGRGHCKQLVQSALRIAHHTVQKPVRPTNTAEILRVRVWQRSDSSTRGSSNVGQRKRVHQAREVVLDAVQVHTGRVGRVDSGSEHIFTTARAALQRAVFSHR